MVEFLRRVRHKTFLSEFMYCALNIGLAGLLFVLSQTIQMPLIAIGIVLMSKWRVLAVRPRYWWANIQANMVDIIVGVSVVVLMYVPEVPMVTQAVLAGLYALWLVVLKPLSKRSHMTLQAFIAIFFGVTALYSVSHEWPVAVVVMSMAAIGYSVARHFLYSQDEEQTVLLSGIWALFFAELGWLAHYWTFSYSFKGAVILQFPQVTIIALALSFTAERLYASWAKHQRIVLNDVILPIVFSWLLILVMLLLFNEVSL